MGRIKQGRTNGSGTLEKRGGIWLARWTVGGKRFTRSTGEKISGGKKAKEAAYKKLEEFTSGFDLKDEKRILEIQVAKLSGIDRKLAEEEAKKPALRFMEGWTAYLASQSRPRSGKATLEAYETQYFEFAKWIEDYHAEITELRQVTRSIADEYAQALLSGTQKEQADEIARARKWLDTYERKRKDETAARQLSEDEQKAIDARRRVAARTIRKPVRGGTFNKHMNALSLIWRHVSRHEKARITLNPWGFDKDTGTGIQRITLNHAERPHTRRTLTVEEVYNLLKAAQGEMRVLIGIGFYTGLRLGDAVCLKWENIDRVRGTIGTRSRKTDTETKTAIHPALANILHAEAKPKASGYVIPELATLYESGKAGRVMISKKLRALFQSVGIVTSHKDEQGRQSVIDCGFHSLRHTFVTALRERGATLQTAKQLAGHNTERMTEHYTHDSERAVLALPDVTDAAAAKAAASPAALPFIGTAQAKPDTGAAVATPSQGERPARLSLDELKAALSGLSATERGELLRTIGAA